MNIPALTGARFFAAATIVLLHSRVEPFFTVQAFWPFDLSGGVPFFFVLSGFVLTLHAEKYRSHTQFMIARLARIWPAYMAALAFWFAIFWPYTLYQVQQSRTEAATLLTNIAMVQAWIPIQSVYFSFNPPSWSVSVELFFYAAFPAVLWLLRRQSLPRLVVLTLAVMTAQMLVWTLFPAVDLMWLTRNNPLSNLPVFAMGVAAAQWFKGAGRRTGDGTAIQLAALAVMLLANMMFRVEWIGSLWLGTLPLPLSSFISTNAATPAYAAVILALALYDGAPSRWLSRPTLLFLGEISYALYLFHQLIIRWFLDNLGAFSGVPVWAQYAGIWAASLGVSALCYLLVEKPGRRAIVALGAALRRPAAPAPDTAATRLSP